jgi:type IV secretory pathway TraG/TraD family ATPase VirD4
MITVAHQTLSDLDKISEEFKNQILGNTNIRFVFRQDIPKDAETWAAFFGTKQVVKQTYRATDGKATGESSNRESKEFRIHPDTIKELDVGECVFSVKSSKTLMQARIPMRGEIVDPRPVERGPHDLPLPKTQKSEIMRT